MLLAWNPTIPFRGLKQVFVGYGVWRRRTKHTRRSRPRRRRRSRRRTTSAPWPNTRFACSPSDPTETSACASSASNTSPLPRSRHRGLDPFTHLHSSNSPRFNLILNLIWSYVCMSVCLSACRSGFMCAQVLDICVRSGFALRAEACVGRGRARAPRRGAQWP